MHVIFSFPRARSDGLPLPPPPAHNSAYWTTINTKVPVHVRQYIWFISGEAASVYRMLRRIDQ